jgi:hypothetical protein
MEALMDVEWNIVGSRYPFWRYIPQWDYRTIASRLRGTYGQIAKDFDYPVTSQAPVASVLQTN